jgi:hypothetical protein
VVETVGLENRCTGNRTGGSNPSPSATQSGPQRIPATFPYKMREIARFLRLMSANRTRENNLPNAMVRELRAFFLEGRNAVWFN